MTRARLAGALLLATLLGCTAARADADHPPLWQIKGKHNSVYLLGSVHVLRESDGALPAPVMAAYRDAEVMYMEIDMDDLDPAEAQGFTLENGMLPGDETLETLLGPERYAKAKSSAQAIGVNLDMLAKLEPWVVAITVVQAQLMQLGLDPEQGVEQQLVRTAQQDGKEIRGLETLGDQLGVLDSLPLDRQEDFLFMSLEEAAEMRGEIDDLIAAWRRGDNAKLDRLLSEEFKEFPELYQPLIVKRNRNWTEQILHLLDDNDDYLIVVGALHLVGQDSVLEMLRARGASARPYP